MSDRIEQGDQKTSEFGTIHRDLQAALIAAAPKEFDSPVEFTRTHNEGDFAFRSVHFKKAEGPQETEIQRASTLEMDSSLNVSTGVLEQSWVIARPGADKPDFMIKVQRGPERIFGFVIEATKDWKTSRIESGYPVPGEGEGYDRGVRRFTIDGQGAEPLTVMNNLRGLLMEQPFKDRMPDRRDMFDHLRGFATNHEMNVQEFDWHPEFASYHEGKIEWSK